MKPFFAFRREPKVSQREAEALIIDCTEQPIQRPKYNVMQKAHYLGKKKRHPLKAEHVVAGTGRIVSVSDFHPGKHRDLALRRAGPASPKRARCHADSAC